MPSCLTIKVRRCRPLLGTFVEISASGDDGRMLEDAVKAGFCAIERVQALMNVHDPSSELSLLNQEAVIRPISVSYETFSVLQSAMNLAEESGGAFDITIASTLADWGILPASLRHEHSGCWRDVKLCRHQQVRFLRPLSIDLGGIAKGFAVDQAIQAMKACGITSACVNAGGDLRVTGCDPSTIHLRHPVHPQIFPWTMSLREAAIATSSPCFTEREWRGGRISHLVDASGKTAISGPVSATVRAVECWLADALTKVVLNAPTRAAELLKKYGAEAFVLTA